MDPLQLHVWQELQESRSNPITLHGLQVGEVWALALGCSLSTFAVLARIYTKLRLTRTMLGEDCKTHAKICQSLEVRLNKVKVSLY